MDDCKVTLVILGGSGDLTRRLLLPGLGSVLGSRNGLDVKLVGASSRGLPHDEWQSRVRQALLDGDLDPDTAEKVASTTYYVALDATDPQEWQTFLDSVDEPDRPVVLYFALPPAISHRACEALSQVRLPAGLRIAIEKPFGSDLQSAQTFNELLSQLVPEDRVFRVDHYLGKSTVLNLLGLRFANRIFEPLWNSTHIERVEIIVDEKLALEGRAGYYDHSGALRDMIQSHLLLVMAMFAMEEPARIDAVELRDLMSHTLRQIHVIKPEGSPACRRARYTAGQIDGKQVPNYVDEPGVDASRDTETLAEVNLEIRNLRWKGVPFRLRSGKALGDGMRAIRVQFKEVAYLPEGFQGPAPANVLFIGMAPERIVLKVATKENGNSWKVDETVLVADLGHSNFRPYGEILEGVFNGDPLLSVRGDMAEECWRIMTPVLEAWERNDVPLEEYAAGSRGPAHWRNLPLHTT